MIRTWTVRLKVARDDGGSLSDEGVQALTGLLPADAKPVVSRGDEGTVLVQLTVEARTDMAARSEAERLLREGASSVWSTLALPPFTIDFVDAKKADP